MTGMRKLRVSYFFQGTFSLIVEAWHARTNSSNGGLVGDAVNGTLVNGKS